jgi:hypothetical protein
VDLLQVIPIRIDRRLSVTERRVNLHAYHVPQIVLSVESPSAHVATKVNHASQSFLLIHAQQSHAIGEYDSW